MESGTFTKSQQVATYLGNWSRGKGPLHRQLTGAIIRCIQDGLFLPGSRLPAERALAEILSLSRTTVLNTYQTLRAEGWIESRHGSGTWISSHQAITARQQAYTAVLENSSLMPLAYINREEIVDFTLATPEALPGMLEQMSSFSGDMQHSVLQQRHRLALGLFTLRQQIAAIYQARSMPTDFEQLLITSGAQQALSLIVSLYVQRGDVVLIENPSYFGAMDILRLAGARLVPLEVTKAHVPPRVLRDRIIATGARLIYLTPTHHNPTGITMPEAARKEIAAIADDFGTPLVEDESLVDLHIGGSPPSPIARNSTKGVILTVGSLSKLYWPGLRIGWIRAPLTALQHLTRLKNSLDLGSSIPSQAIAAHLLSGFKYAKSSRAAQMKARRDLLVDLIRQKLPSWEFSVPSGGLCLWVRLPDTDARRFAHFCLRHRMAVMCGPSFSADEGFSDYLRIPYVLDEQAIEEGVNHLAELWMEFNRLLQGRQLDATQVI